LFLNVVEQKTQPNASIYVMATTRELKNYSQWAGSDGGSGNGDRGRQITRKTFFCEYSSKYDHPSRSDYDYTAMRVWNCFMVFNTVKLGMLVRIFTAPARSVGGRQALKASDPARRDVRNAHNFLQDWNSTGTAIPATFSDFPAKRRLSGSNVQSR
jgi:hypothetical protein